MQLISGQNSKFVKTRRTKQKTKTHYIFRYQLVVVHSNGLFFFQTQTTKPVSELLCGQNVWQDDSSPSLTSPRLCPKQRLRLQLWLDQRGCQCWRIGKQAWSSCSCRRSRCFGRTTLLSRVKVWPQEQQYQENRSLARTAENSQPCCSWVYRHVRAVTLSSRQTINNLSHKASVTGDVQLQGKLKKLKQFWILILSR